MAPVGARAFEFGYLRQELDFGAAAAPGRLALARCVGTEEDPFMNLTVPTRGRTFRERRI